MRNDTIQEGSPLGLRGRSESVAKDYRCWNGRRRGGRISSIIIIINVEAEFSERFLRTKTRFSSCSPGRVSAGGHQSSGCTSLHPPGFRIIADDCSSLFSLFFFLSFFPFLSWPREARDRAATASLEPQIVRNLSRNFSETRVRSAGVSLICEQPEGRYVDRKGIIDIESNVRTELARE